MVIVDRDEEATARVLVDNLPIGKLVLQDQLRGDAVTAISALNRQGMTVSILSGDRLAAALAIAGELGVDKQQVVAEATPASKASHIQLLGKETIMVGDGLNDAAALATSGLGVALASGTNVAIEAAAVVIPGDRVQAIPETHRVISNDLANHQAEYLFRFLLQRSCDSLGCFWSAR